MFEVFAGASEKLNPRPPQSSTSNICSVISCNVYCAGRRHRDDSHRGNDAAGTTRRPAKLHLQWADAEGPGACAARNEDAKTVVPIVGFFKVRLLPDGARSVGRGRSTIRHDGQVSARGGGRRCRHLHGPHGLELSSALRPGLTDDVTGPTSSMAAVHGEAATSESFRHVLLECLSVCAGRHRWIGVVEPRPERHPMVANVPATLLPSRRSSNRSSGVFSDRPT